MKQEETAILAKLLIDSILVYLNLGLFLGQAQ